MGWEVEKARPETLEEKRARLAALQAEVDAETGAPPAIVDVTIDPDPSIDGQIAALDGQVAKLELARGSAEVKLDFACGAHCREGFEGVDRVLRSGAEVVENGARTGRHHSAVKYEVDLMKFPLPWADSSVDEIHCSHFIEHLPLREVEDRDLRRDVKQVGQCMLPAPDGFVGRDFLFAFFDECWRILKPGGFMTVICPSVRSERAFQDPTHRRFITTATFFYLAATERKAMGLDHYPAECDFEGNVVFTHAAEIGARAREVQERVFREAWNAIQDYSATLKAHKPART